MEDNVVDTRKHYLARLKDAFSVSPQAARDIIGDFHQEMRHGLDGGVSSLKMLPAYIRRPQGTEAGYYLALDLGGTHFRVLAVELDGRRRAKVKAVSKFTIPQHLMAGDGDSLFDFIADGIRTFFVEHLPREKKAYELAFTFSFPMEQHTISSGKLIEWTKGFSTTGVEGQDVVALLTRAMARKGLDHIQVTALANDTVGTLMAGCYEDPACDMGVILGTGTNACYPEQGERIRKEPAFGACGEIIVNLEWGNFDKLNVTRYDQRVDDASWNAGRQRLEKMVSGMYMGEIARRIIEDMTGNRLLFGGHGPVLLDHEYALTTEHLSGIAGGKDIFAELGLIDVSAEERQTVDEIGRIVSTRSARIAGTAIAAVITWMDPDLARDHAVAIDGALFEKYRGYENVMKAILLELFGDRAARIKLKQVRDGSGIGSAIIGAVAASGFCRARACSQEPLSKTGGES